AEKMFGYTEAEALGHDLVELVAPESSGRHAEARAYSAALARGEAVRGLVQRTRKDGTPIDVEMLAVPVLVAGQPAGTIVVYHDVTDLQRARQDAEAANQAKSAF